VEAASDTSVTGVAVDDGVGVSCIGWVLPLLGPVSGGPRLFHITRTAPVDRPIRWATFPSGGLESTCNSASIR
jgi:hypothetical protein